ncbi:GATA zinc finger domain-containing protein 14-like [Drosophila montana]|uniref:GATA zinc finger domain-containing protein 14-like n=1 Tax=Drosophila montana TaxID=40370 RepID=UPI00313B5F82
MSKQFEDHYGTLGIDQKATNEQIRTSYIRLVRIWHPDKNPRQGAKGLEFCKALNRAYGVLSDPVLRRDYDRIYNVHRNQKECQESQSQGQGNNSSHHQQENAKSSNDRGYKQDNQNQKKNQDQYNKRSSHQENAKSNNDRGYQRNNQNQKKNQDQENKKRYHQENAKSNNDRGYKPNNEYQKNTGNQEYKKYDQHSHQDRNNYENQRGYQNQNNDYSRWHEHRNNQDWSNRSSHYSSQYENFERNRSGPDNANLYEILGLKTNAKKQDIESAFRKLAMQYGNSENSAVKRQFQKILGAYLVLSDPVLRANYDRENHNNSERRSNYGTFTFFSNEHFDEWRSSFFNNPGIWKAICLVCIGGGYVLIIVCKWTVIILYHLAKYIIKILPPLLLLLGKLICIIVPPLFKGSIFLLKGLAISIGWSFKMLLRCVIG